MIEREQYSRLPPAGLAELRDDAPLEARLSLEGCTANVHD